MAALQAEDSVKEIRSTIDSVYDALVKEFHLGDQGEKDKDAIQMVSNSIEQMSTNTETYALFPTAVAHHVVQLQSAKNLKEDAD